MDWILLVLLYGLLKGGREIAKKLALKKNSVMDVLVVYTLLSFLFVIPQIGNAGGLELKFYFYIAIKSFCIFLAWICSFYSIKKLPISLYGILDLSRVLFATFFGVAFLGEILNFWQLLGLIVVCAGLIMLKFKPKSKKTQQDNGSSGQDATAENALTGTLPQYPASTDGCADEDLKTKFYKTTTFFVILAFISCILNAVSGFLDKVLMKDISSSQLQFWYMLFLISYYLIYMLFTKQKVEKTVWKNGWVWLLAIMFVIGDKALFIANGNPASKITVMTLIKQSGCLVTILGGRFVFKEKNTGYRLICACVIIAGIVLGVCKF